MTFGISFIYITKKYMQQDSAVPAFMLFHFVIHYSSSTSLSYWRVKNLNSRHIYRYSTLNIQTILFSWWFPDCKFSRCSNVMLPKSITVGETSIHWIICFQNRNIHVPKRFGFFFLRSFRQNFVSWWLKCMYQNVWRRNTEPTKSPGIETFMNYDKSKSTEFSFICINRPFRPSHWNTTILMKWFWTNLVWDVTPLIRLRFLVHLSLHEARRLHGSLQNTICLSPINLSSRHISVTHI